MLVCEYISMFGPWISKLNGGVPIKLTVISPFSPGHNAEHDEM